MLLQSALERGQVRSFRPKAPGPDRHAAPGRGCSSLVSRQWHRHRAPRPEADLRHFPEIAPSPPLSGYGHWPGHRAESSRADGRPGGAGLESWKGNEVLVAIAPGAGMSRNTAPI